jgi:hypothetical protein
MANPAPYPSVVLLLQDRIVVYEFPAFEPTYTFPAVSPTAALNTEMVLPEYASMFEMDNFGVKSGLIGSYV